MIGFKCVSVIAEFLYILENKKFLCVHFFPYRMSLQNATIKSICQIIFFLQVSNISKIDIRKITKK